MVSPVFLIILFALTGLAIGLLPFNRAATVGLAIALAPSFLAVAWTAIDMASKKGSHNLFPLEIAGVAGATTIPALMGLGAGFALRHFMAIPRLVFVSIAAISITLAVFSFFMMGGR